MYLRKKFESHRCNLKINLKLKLLYLPVMNKRRVYTSVFVKDNVQHNNRYRVRKGELMFNVDTHSYEAYAMPRYRRAEPVETVYLERSGEMEG